MAGVAGRSGMRPKTTQEHVIRGTFLEKSHGGHTSPEPPKGTPEPPVPLDAEHQPHWNRILRLLSVSGCLTTVDGESVYQYCRLFVNTERSAERKAFVMERADALAEQLKGLQGSELAHGMQAIAKLYGLEARYTAEIRQGQMAIRTYLVEFGLTPAARGRVKIAKPQTPESKWAGLVS